MYIILYDNIDNNNIIAIYSRFVLATTLNLTLKRLFDVFYPSVSLRLRRRG